MTITYKELQLCRERWAQRYEFEQRLEAFDPADVFGEIFFDGDAIRQGLNRRGTTSSNQILKTPKNLFSFD